MKSDATDYPDPISSISMTGCNIRSTNFQWYIEMDDVASLDAPFFIPAGGHFRADNSVMKVFGNTVFRESYISNNYKRFTWKSEILGKLK